jgi:hypothetical protein
MTARKLALLIAALAAALLSAVGFVLLHSERQAGVLEPYSGMVHGLCYAGAGQSQGGTNTAFFRFFNAGSRATELRPRPIFRQVRGGGEWIQEQFNENTRIRIPARHVLTFEFRCPKGESPWRATFEESTVPHPSEWFADAFKRMLGRRSSIPPFDGIFATPIMQGSTPTAEPSDTPNSGPSKPLPNSNRRE